MSRLRVEDLSIEFGGVRAVDGLSFEIGAARVHAIIGPNGAGKTTFFNLISGQLRASEGRVRLDGVDITNDGVSARTHRGLGRAFQLTQLFANLSVVENVRLAVQSRRREGFNLWSVWLDHRNTLEQAHQLVDLVKLGDRADVPASSLPHGDQRKLEVAMLMALEPSVYMFDEPTAGMSVDDVPVILDLIRTLKARGDKTILLVEHKMDVVRELADRIIVLHNGALVADGEPAAVIASPIVQEAYLGVAAGKEPA